MCFDTKAGFLTETHLLRQINFQLKKITCNYLDYAYWQIPGLLKKEARQGERKN